MEGGVDEWREEWMNGGRSGQMEGGVDEWREEWMNGGKNG